MKNVCIVTPTHKNALDDDEVFRIKYSLRKNLKIPHFFVVPESLKVDTMLSKFPKSSVQFFDEKYFVSTQAYSNLMLSESFYRRFDSYTFMIILQADAILLKSIDDLLELNLPYIGASWNPGFTITTLFDRIVVNRSYVPGRRYKIEVGNGGLSLRNIHVILSAFKAAQNVSFLRRQLNPRFRRINEDLLIVLMLDFLGYESLSKEIADTIFIETSRSTLAELKFKYGAHALSKYQPILEKQLLNELSRE
jgi:hypothetical protein